MRDVVERAMRGDHEAFGVPGQPDQRPDVRDRDADPARHATSPRTPCRAPSSRPGASFRGYATRIVSRPGSGACSSTPATPRPGVAGNGRRTFESCRSTGRPARTSLLSVTDRDALDRAFRRLTLEQRAVFVLHHHVGLPLVEIAETLGIPAGTARSRLHYATRLLRSAIEADMAPVVPEGRMA